MTSPSSPTFPPTRFGGLALTGWVGHSPEDGEDFAFLLLYTTGGGLGPGAAPAAMKTALARVGLHVGQMLRGPQQIADVAVTLTLTGDTVDLTLTGQDGPGGEPIASAALDSHWDSVARGRGEVMLTACTRPYRHPEMTLEHLDAFMSEVDTLSASAFAFLPIR